MRITQKLQNMKNERVFERYSKKILKNYWGAYNKGIRFSEEYEDNISNLIDAKIKIFLQKKEIAELKRSIRKNRYKAFYVNYLMSFVMTDKGQILFRGRFLFGLLLVLKLRLEMLGIFLHGYSIRENPYISTSGGFRCYFGLKRAMRGSGYPQEVLLKSTEQILSEKNQK